MSAAGAGVAFCDGGPTGFSWIAPTPDWMARTSHALVADGRVWLVDPVDFPGLDDRVRALGEPVGVLQLLAWHHRDCAAVAARLGVAHDVTPAAVPGSPFDAVQVPGIPRWRETALWWESERTLVVAEAVGTVRYYGVPGRALGVHPILRFLRPPQSLLRFEPAHILCGHGPGLHDGATDALRDAVVNARRDIPRALPRILGARRHPAAVPASPG